MAIRATLDDSIGFTNPRVVYVPGAAPALEFDFLLQQHTRKQGSTFVNYSIYVRAKVGSQELYLTEARLSTLRPFAAGLLPGSEYSSRWTINVPISFQAIGLLENARRTASDGAVTFIFHWEIAILPASEGTRYGEMIVEVVDPEPQVKFPRDDWHRVLDRLGWGLKKVVEIDYPKAELAAWQKAFSHLEAAEDSYRSRKDNAVLLECENALEAISTNTGSNFLAQLVKDLQGAIAGQEKAKVVGEAVDRVGTFVRRGKHFVGSPRTPLFEADGRDAELALNWTKALIVYISKVGLTGNENT